MGKGLGRVSVEIRRLSLEDVFAMSAVHLAAFPASALSRLGEEAVRRYYQWQFAGPHETHVSGAFHDGRLVGFCVGGVFRRAMGGFLNTNSGFLFRRVLTHPWLLMNPLFRDKVNIAWQIFRRSVRMSTRTEAAGSVERGVRPFAILAICVDPSLHRGGVGRTLMSVVEDEARTLGFREMALTVRTDNRKAIGFYHSLGWERSPTERADTVAMRKKL